MSGQVFSCLPDPLVFSSGTLVHSVAEWARRRTEIRELLVPLVYGELPPAPARTRCVQLHVAAVRRLAGARLITCRVETDGRHAFLLRLFVPQAHGPFPVLLNGDGCWHYASDEVIAEVLARGNVFAQFNRVEIAADMPGGAESPDLSALPPPVAAGVNTDAGGLRDSDQLGRVSQAVIPYAGTARDSDRLFRGQPCAALAAWAWGYQRAVDALLQLDFVDGDRVAVLGHSRGGKAALLAGAIDDRIALTSANHSGAGGAGCFRLLGSGAESLADVVSAFPHWFGPRLAQYAGREQELPCDQHFLKALIAPRALLTTEALGDLWANPSGTWQTHLAARAVYAFLGGPERIAIAYREGGHDHNFGDWCTLLDFCDVVFRGKSRAEVLAVNPFPDLPAAFGWSRDVSSAA